MKARRRKGATFPRCPSFFLIHAHTYAHAHINTLTHTYTHSHTHTHTHTHTHRLVFAVVVYQKSQLVWETTIRRFLDMRWLRFVGSFQLYVSFTKESYKTDDILQKRPMILRSLLTVATPYCWYFSPLPKRRDPKWSSGFQRESWMLKIQFFSKWAV